MSGEGIARDIAGTAMDLFVQHGVPWLAKKGIEAGRYYASEVMRDPRLQKKVLNYGMRKATPLAEKVGHELFNQLSTKVRPNRRYKTDRPDLDGRGIPVPFPFVDLRKAWSVLSDPTLFKGPKVSEKEGMAIVNEYKRQYNDYKRKGGTCSYGSWIKWKGYGQGLTGGKGVDVHAMIGKLPAPKKGWTLPGHKYTGPYNPLDKQVKYDPDTGNILNIYDQPTGPTNAIAMSHDVDYATCSHRAKKYGENEKQCKHAADQKMVKSLDFL